MEERPRFSGKFPCAPEFIIVNAYKFLLVNKEIHSQLHLICYISTSLLLIKELFC